MTDTVKKGQRISVDSATVGEATRQGEVLEVIEHDYGTSFRVRWDDGHESTFRPNPGTLHRIEPEATPSAGD